MIRKIDNCGRLVISHEMREAIGLKNNEECMMKVDGDKIIITKPKRVDLMQYIREHQFEVDDKEVIEVLDLIEVIE